LLGPDVIRFAPSEYGGTQEVLVKECKVLGNKSYMIRTKANENEKGTQPINIIEIVSDVNFREKYNLKDRDKIEIIL
jgi:CTP-dependent riboflavin kinase